MGSGISHHNVTIEAMAPPGMAPLATVREALEAADDLRRWPQPLFEIVESYAQQSMFIIVYGRMLHETAQRELHHLHHPHHHMHGHDTLFWALDVSLANTSSSPNCPFMKNSKWIKLPLAVPDASRVTVSGEYQIGVANKQLMLLAWSPARLYSWPLSDLSTITPTSLPWPCTTTEVGERLQHVQGVASTMTEQDLWFRLGGLEQQRTSTANCDIYDTRTSSWNVPHRVEGRCVVSRHCAAAAAIGNDIILCGGYHNGGSQPLVTAEKWDHTVKKWAAIPSMNIGRAWHAMVMVPKLGLICAGGIADKSIVLDSVEIYDINTHTWKLMDAWKLPIATHRHTLLFFNFHLYLFDTKGIWMMNPFHHLLLRDPSIHSIWTKIATPASPWSPQGACGVSLTDASMTGLPPLSEALKPVDMLTMASV